MIRQNTNYRSGFVAIIGRPNVGKSTLLNTLVGEKVAIMSDKPQTTRNKIRGILTRNTGQIVFIDTPGIHKPVHKLGEQMVRAALSTLEEVDLILWVVDITAPIGTGEQYVAESLKKVHTPVFLLLNKIDVFAGDITEKVESFRQIGDFRAYFPISALQRKNTEELVDAIMDVLPLGPQYYPEDEVTDQPEKFIIAEIVREKILHLTRDEVPHSVAVQVEEVKERTNGLVYVRANIYVERNSQKGIIVGKGGQMLKKIGELARADIENLLGSTIYLDLWVKVKEDWRNQSKTWNAFGLDQ